MGSQVADEAQGDIISVFVFTKGMFAFFGYRTGIRAAVTTFDVKYFSCELLAFERCISMLFPKIG